MGIKTFSSKQIASALLSSLPEREDLTLVGGRALEYWVEQYRHSHPDLFENIKGIPTRDLDFVIQNKSSIRKCVEAWRAELQKIGATLNYDVAGFDDHTPEIAHTSVELNPNADKADRWFMTDFLFDLKGISSKEIKEGRVPLGNTQGNHYVLSEYLSLVNRACNVAQIKSKQDLKSITQLRQSIMVNKAYLRDLLDIRSNESIREALKHVKRIKQLALKKEVGLQLIRDRGINLLDAIPEDHLSWPENFVKKNLPQMKEEIMRRVDQNSLTP